MKEINKEIEEPLSLGEGKKSAGVGHHSFWESFPRTVIKAVATGSMTDWVGNDEGQILFQPEGFTGAEGHYENTTLISGGDGFTTYMKVRATYTATEATVIQNLRLYGTSYNRTERLLFSEKTGVNQSLDEGQSYTVYWTIHADI